MSGSSAEERPALVIARVLRRTGLGFPRGMLDDDTARLAAMLEDPGVPAATLEAQVDAAAAGLWFDLQAPTVAAVRMHVGRAGGDDRADLERVLQWAEREDPANPLARALTVRAARELAAAVRHAEDQLRAAEGTVRAGGRQGALAAARAMGAAVVGLLDLDPEDFALEIIEYIDDDQSAAALDALARATGDLETRAWAREVLAALRVPDAPASTAAIHQLSADAPPDDPSEDAVWVPAILALVDEGLERALAAEVEAAGPD